ncbi:MAG TPA: hypothetical protein VFV96_15330 [Verrucomicrobiae bacterium]|nr:hypothetical protein [Verrucomicrobiae bacterium]
MNEFMQKVRKIVQILIILVVITGGIWAYAAFREWQSKQNERTLGTEVDQLFEAFHKYKQIVGKYPQGSNAEIAKAIREGDNEKHLMIMAVKDSQLNAKGEVVDPWGTPLKIYFAQNEVLIRSAGPNKQFEDAKNPKTDDYFRSD